MVKRALTLLTSIIFALTLLMPFNIYGATWGDAPIIGINVYAIDYDYNQVPFNTYINLDTNQTRWHCASSHSSMGCQTWVSENIDGNTTKSITGNLYTQSYHDVTAVLYKYEIVFDKTYVGRIHINWTNTSTTTVFSRYLYVNGDSVEFTSTVYSDSFSIDSYQLEYAPIEVINASKSWDFPVESFNAVSMLINRFTIVDYYNLNNWSYPVFKVPSGSKVLEKWVNANSSCIFILSIQGQMNKNNFSNRFRLENYTDFVVQEIQYSSFASIYKITVTAENTDFVYLYTTSEQRIIPFFNSISNYQYISTDFALQFGLRNELLDNLNIIANGTTASSSTAQSSDIANSQLQTDSNTLFTQEDNFKSDMQNAMQNVNNTFRLQDMGTKFVSSAQWVRTQYENFTNNTPFASLITFSLITGLALILLGKVYK